MILENKRSRILEPALASSGLSLIAGSVLCFAAAYSLHQLNTAPAVNVDFSGWNWLSSVKVQVDAEPAQKAFVAPIDPFSVLVDASKPIEVYQPSPLKEPSPIRPVRQAIVASKKKPPHHPPTVVASAPREVQKIQPVVQMENSEAQKMQQLFGMLTNQFHVAMTIQPGMAARVLALREAEEHKAIVEADEPAAREVPPEPLLVPAHPHHRLARHIVTKAKEEKKIQVVASAEEMGPREAYGPELDRANAPASVDDEISLSSAAAAKALDQVTTQTTQQDDSVADEDEPAEEILPGAPPISTVNSRLSNPTEIVQLAKSVGYGAPAAHTGIVVASARTPVTTQPQPKAPAPMAYHAADYSPAPTAPSAAHVALNTLSTQNLMAAFAPVTTHSFNLPETPIRVETAVGVEAFDWGTQVPDLTLGEVTHESATPMEIPAGYLLGHASDHWPTLIRRPATTVPLVSSNSAKLLAAISGAALQSETGIVFGKVAAGWSVRLSGRAERAVFFNSNHQAISAQSLEGERYFAFVNAEPGAHLLYLTNSAGVEEGAVGVGVFSGISSYLDLTSVSSTVVRGRVLDGSGTEAAPLAKARVRVLGNSNSETTTDDSGIFQLDHVLTVGTYPVYFETDVRDGYTHRYQLKPSQLGGVVLYRLSSNAIQTWIGQLEGSLSNDGGLVVAAAPNLAASAQTPLLPRVTSVIANPTLRPEVYTVAPSGQLQVGVQVDEKNSRVLSVQVPEGPVLMSFESPDKKEIWSDFLVASPNVVSIVGPL